MLMARMRAAVSVEPPAPDGTTSLIGFSGYSPAASDDHASGHHDQMFQDGSHFSLLV
jgi:hypothetical protein